MRHAHVFVQPANTQRQYPRGQVRHRAPGQDHELRVVGNEVQVAKLLLFNQFTKMHVDEVAIRLRSALGFLSGKHSCDTPKIGQAVDLRKTGFRLEAEHTSESMFRSRDGMILDRKSA